jgi:hypothetical protein
MCAHCQFKRIGQKPRDLAFRGETHGAQMASRIAMGSRIPTFRGFDAAYPRRSHMTEQRSALTVDIMRICSDLEQRTSPAHAEIWGEQYNQLLHMCCDGDDPLREVISACLLAAETMRPEYPIVAEAWERAAVAIAASEIAIPDSPEGL